MLTILDDSGYHFFTRLILNETLWVCLESSVHCKEREAGALFWCLAMVEGKGTSQYLLSTFHPHTFHKGFKEAKQA